MVILKTKIYVCRLFWLERKSQHFEPPNLSASTKAPCWNHSFPCSRETPQPCKHHTLRRMHAFFTQSDGSSQSWLFQTWLLATFTRKRPFALSCTLLRPFALFCELAFALFCAHLCSFALICVFLRPTAFGTTTFGLGTAEDSDLKKTWQRQRVLFFETSAPFAQIFARCQNLQCGEPSDNAEDIVLQRITLLQCTGQSWTRLSQDLQTHPKLRDCQTKAFDQLIRHGLPKHYIRSERPISDSPDSMILEQKQTLPRPESWYAIPAQGWEISNEAKWLQEKWPCIPERSWASSFKTTTAFWDLKSDFLSIAATIS